MFFYVHKTAEQMIGNFTVDEHYSLIGFLFSSSIKTKPMALKWFVKYLCPDIGSEHRLDCYERFMSTGSRQRMPFWGNVYSSMGFRHCWHAANI